MLKKIVAISSATALLMSSAYADGSLSFITKFDSESGIVRLDGSGKGNITVRIAPDGVLPEQFATNPPPVFDTIFADGEFVYECQLPLSATGGGYTVYLRDSETTVTDSFRYFLIDVANAIVTDDNGINDALEASDYELFASIIDSNASDLGIDTDNDVYKTKSDDIFTTLYNSNEKFEDANAFYAKYSEAFALASMQAADRTTVENLLKKYETYLGINSDSDYFDDSKLTEAAKETLCTLVSGYDFAAGLSNGETFKEMFDNLKALSAVKSAEKWQDISKAMTDTFKAEFQFVFDENGDYSSLSSLTPVYSEMMNSIANAKSLSDIQQSFDNIVDSLLTSEAPSSSGGGGGGGGGSVSMPRVEQAVDAPKPPVSAMTNPFGDIDKDFWGYNAIVEMSARSAINGYEDGTFRPNQTITRAEFVKILTSLAALDAADAEFEDVKSGSWYAPFVGAAAKAGLVTGDGSRFNPDQPITRQDTAVIVYRLLSGKNSDLFKDKKIFADETLIADYARDAVAFLGGAGVVNGTDGGNFNPTGNLTRAEAAQLLFNASEYIR
ncbi:MAG: S-layer homology domain-containing protein [Clostridia bacterium]|nr:S-layer homology domain-containing protein [Clostridia bacterium]